MDPEIATKLRAEFAQGETWGWQRALCAQATFWDSKCHARLTDLSDRQILIALIWANFYASQWASALRLRCDETRLWKRHFVPLVAVELAELRRKQHGGYRSFKRQVSNSKLDRKTPDKRRPSRIRVKPIN
jgi:hypothetical protein